MHAAPSTPAQTSNLTLVIGATGKIGGRVAARLEGMGLPVRRASRSASVPFDWNDPATWDAALAGVAAAYISYAPDLAIPGAADAIAALLDRARQAGVGRVVLLSGRGEDEAQRCERIVADSGLDWTVVRASWFNQNFDEGAFLDMVLSGQIALPAADIGEPFVDAGDIADVAVTALTDQGHAAQIYEVTGPRLLTFAEAARTIARASGRDVRFVRIPREAFAAGVAGMGLPDDVAWLLDYLFSTVLDGRNASVCDGVERALSRAPRDFADYATAAAATGIWRAAA